MGLVTAEGRKVGAIGSDPSTIAPGSVVVVRDEEWLVRSTEETSDGLLVTAQGLGELVRDTEATFYAALDKIVPLDPAAGVVIADSSPQHRTARLWLESTIRKTAVPLGDQSLTVSARALADPLSYQQSAVRKALDPANLRPRILLADAVGLGKTLEIGMILAELVRRGRGDRILIVTPRHVLEQMQHEMWSRFALPFVRLDSAGIQRVRQKLPSTRNPFTFYRRVIISIDTLKSDRYLAHLSKQRWDAVVIDESHNLSNASTLNNRLARVLARNAESLILASATPHNGNPQSFAELIRLLDPTAVRPDGSLDEEEVARLVIRRHRHSPEVAGVVGADWAERQEPQNLLVPASAAENVVAQELGDVWLRPVGGVSPYSGQASGLFPWALAKAFLSSPAALRETATERRRRLGSGPAADAERSALTHLIELTDAATTTSSAKYVRLVEHLREVGIGKGSSARVVVFAERIATLRWLQDHLPKSLGLPTGAIEIMHSGLPDEEQQRVVEAFKQESSAIRVLVTGDVASEGVNLHAQCHELVHYDIPWSLIRIEQRNGRIDRYGQKFPPRITALLLETDAQTFTGDLRVLTRLVEKEHEAHGALGDVASLMGRYDVKAEEEDIRKVLAGERDLEDVVRSVEDVTEADDLTGLFFRMFDEPQTPATAPQPPQALTTATNSGLYPDEVSYLDDALHAAYIDPSGPVSDRGVMWRRDDAFGTAELVPPRDLVQRLEVLPQTYLADRQVTSRLVLATTPARGRLRLAAALTDTSMSSWPDAHFLGPLHPVLEWASDRALATLGRNEVFAVRGEVDAPTVLLLGTLTNRRGQVVSAAWLTAQFPDMENIAFAIMTPHESVAAALAECGWQGKQVNAGPIGGAQDLTALIRPAVHKARSQMRDVFAAAETDVASRVARWSEKLDGWDAEAGALIQRNELRQHRVRVEQERELVEAMNPDRQLVRPLVVVVPQNFGQIRGGVQA
ncbi:Type III restriction enzyme, res subunit [Sanguibacter gelidistatuariae]|uniref:Type III restriction enzyme, res subunit n=1 Tax=Sanguibacter gelidistatuariae TaxID=1814289 RepID=A0A1G6SWM3_9MICO|nr:helicase-related protein [Sanguibacter gelidistatuariae]SDD20545.1 Type III restriction enzyme, res subunit [Sanguibacter gelidistatuariae]